MIINPEAKRILCYGDSNTWGQKAHEAGRHPVNTRWTGRLQMALGDTFEIIEEGLSARTTDIDYPHKPGRNGRTYLQPCVVSQSPLDTVVLMLGTNDLKIEFGPRSPKEIAGAIEGLVSDVIRLAKSPEGSSPDIVLVSPILINPDAPAFRDNYAPNYYNEDSVQLARELAAHIHEVADRHHCYFIDAANVAEAGTDGIHMSEEGHHALAALLAEKIKEWA
jgi:lysophospholipase L1-like esterase